MRPTTWICGLGIALTLGAASPLHAQLEQRSVFWGGTGGTRNYNLDCGGGGVLVGVSVRSGMWIDQLSVICREVRTDGTLGNVFTQGPVGGAGGSADEVRCLDNEVAVRMSAYFGIYVNGLGLSCRRWSPRDRSVVGGTLSRGFVGASTGASFGLRSSEFTCSGSSAVVKALRGRSGAYVDRVQVVCRLWNL